MPFSSVSILYFQSKHTRSHTCRKRDTQTHIAARHGTAFQPHHLIYDTYKGTDCGLFYRIIKWMVRVFSILLFLLHRLFVPRMRLYSVRLCWLAFYRSSSHKVLYLYLNCEYQVDCRCYAWIMPRRCISITILVIFKTNTRPAALHSSCYFFLFALKRMKCVIIHLKHLSIDDNTHNIIPPNSPRVMRERLIYSSFERSSRILIVILLIELSLL